MKKYMFYAKANKKEIRFATPLMFTNRDLAGLIIPLVIEQFLAVAVGLFDTIMISSVGEAAVSGVSLVETIVILMIQFFSALATGGAVVVGHYIGQRKEEDASDSAHQLVLFLTITSVVITTLILLFRNPILSGVFGNIADDVRGHADVYLIIVGLSIPFIALYNGGAAVFRAAGNSRIPMYIAVLMNFMNIGGNAVLIYGLKMGVAGAAISTLVSRIVAAVIVLVLLCNPKHPVHIKKKLDFHLDWRVIKKILHIGVPNSLENSMFQLGKILVLSLVTSFGTAAIAANAVSNNIAMFQNLPGISIGLAMLTVISQCMGAGDHEQAKYFTRKLMTITYICAFVVIGGILLGLPLILRLFSLSDETMDIARQIVTYHGIVAMFLWPLSFALPNTLRAAGDVKYPMILSILSMWIFRIMFSYVLGRYLGWGVFGVWVAMTIDWLFRGICFVFRYVRGKWQYKEV